MVAVAAMIVVSATAQDKTTKLKKNEAEVTYLVSIDCPHCVAKLEAKLPFEKGVKDLKVSLETTTIWFKYDVRKTDVEKLKTAIEKLGYEAKVLDKTKK